MLRSLMPMRWAQSASRACSWGCSHRAPVMGAGGGHRQVQALGLCVLDFIEQDLHEPAIAAVGLVVLRQALHALQQGMQKWRDGQRMTGARARRAGFHNDRGWPHRCS
jgi:hypothetical protein